MRETFNGIPVFDDEISGIEALDPEGEIRKSIHFIVGDPWNDDKWREIEIGPALLVREVSKEEWEAAVYAEFANLPEDHDVS